MSPHSWSLFNLFKKRRRSDSEILEELEENIKNLNEYRLSAIISARRLTLQLVLVCFVFFGFVLAAFYFYIKPSGYLKTLFFTLIAIIYPLIIWIVKLVISKLCEVSIRRCDNNIKDILSKKRKILLDVMETKTYNRAQQILRRFDPKLLLQVNEMSNLKLFQLNKLDGDLSGAMNNSINTSPKSVTPIVEKTVEKTTCSEAKSMKKNPISLHRPIFPRERSLLDKIIDAFASDGPNRRYALICQQCFGHNGMALPEEFEYLAFRCCYCSLYNPAHRVRRNTLFSHSDSSSNPHTDLQRIELHSQSMNALDRVGALRFGQDGLHQSTTGASDISLSQTVSDADHEDIQNTSGDNYKL